MMRRGRGRGRVPYNFGSNMFNTPPSPPYPVTPVTPKEEEEDILDTLICSHKKTLHKKKLKETPKIIRPPISFAKHTEILRTRDMEDELSKVQKKLLEKEKLLKEAEKSYFEIISDVSEQNSKISKSCWSLILKFLDAQNLLKMMRINTFFKRLSSDDDLWENLFTNIIPVELLKDFKVLGNTYFEKFTFLFNKGNYDAVPLDIISTTGGSLDVSCEVENLVNATYDNIGVDSYLPPTRFPYSTKFGKLNNIDILMKSKQPHLVFNCSITVPNSTKYANPVNNCLVFMSQEEFKIEEIKKIEKLYNHILKEDIESVKEKAKNIGSLIPSFEFWEISKFGKEEDEEKRTCTVSIKTPIIANFILLKLIDKDGKGSNIDISGFSVFGIRKETI